MLSCIFNIVIHCERTSSEVVSLITFIFGRILGHVV
jgi:hypothetical protein